MTPVRIHLISADGQPVANTQFYIQMPRFGFDESGTEIALPQKITATTDETGVAVVELYPVKQHPYTLVAAEWNSRTPTRMEFFVPESAVTVELREIVHAVPPTNTPYDTEAIQLITQSKVDAQAAENGAQLAQSLAETAQAAAETAQGLSEAAQLASEQAQAGSESARDLSLQYSNNAKASQDAALLSEQAADVSEAAALASEDKAQQWAEELEDVAVEVGLYSAKHHALKAAASASAASTSETNALASENAAKTSETNAAASETAAATSEVNAKTSETNSAGSASAAATSETNAAGSASAAATSETNAAASESAALASELKAKDWATYAGEVEPGLKSAKEYAKDAKATMANALAYQGVWDASTGIYPTPELKGDMWKVSVAGTVNGVDFKVGDHLIYNGGDAALASGWDHIDNTESVTSVGGNVGAVSDAQLLDAVKRVDGPGSGLDADTLDGKQLATLETEYKAYADQAELDANTYTDTGLADKVDKTTYTAEDVLAKVKAVDGATSGLDADLLDGKELATLETEYQGYADTAASTAETNAKRYADDQAFIMALIFG